MAVFDTDLKDFKAILQVVGIDPELVETILKLEQPRISNQCCLTGGSRLQKTGNRTILRASTGRY